MEFIQDRIQDRIQVRESATAVFTPQGAET
jgi:hypothetical protein